MALSRLGAAAGRRAGSRGLGGDTAALSLDPQARGSRGVHAAARSLHRLLQTPPLGRDRRRCPPRLRPPLHRAHLLCPVSGSPNPNPNPGAVWGSGSGRRGKEWPRGPLEPRRLGPSAAGAAWAGLPGAGAAHQATCVVAPGTAVAAWRRAAQGRPTHACCRGPRGKALTGLSLLPTKRWPRSVPAGKSGLPVASPVLVPLSGRWSWPTDATETPAGSQAGEPQSPLDGTRDLSAAHELRTPPWVTPGCRGLSLSFAL